MGLNWATLLQGYRNSPQDSSRADIGVTAAPMSKAPINFAAMTKTLARDIELAILSDPIAAGLVYVDLEGFSPRILADINDPQRFKAFAERFFGIVETLHTTFRSGGDGHPRPRGLTYKVDSTKASNHQRLEARKELAARLESAGCDNQEIARLIAPSG